MYNAKKHFENLYATVPRKYAFNATTSEGVISWQANFRPELRQILGLDNMESDLAGYTPKAEQLEVLDMDNHIRESWYLWVEPTVPLPFYLLRPKTVEGKVPLILAPHGHNHPHIYVGIAQFRERGTRDGGRGTRYCSTGSCGRGVYCYSTHNPCFR